MNIKIADRLIKLRKENGLSQEELAAKLGLSRQAVSKWERAEASPDTDNLICLAKLYRVSLDELLQDDDDIETIVKEQVKSEFKQNTTEDNENCSTNIKYFKNGVNIQDGDDVINIDSNGVHIVDKDGEVHVGKGGDVNYDLISSLAFGVSSFLALLALILIGVFVPDGWSWSWTFFLLVPIVSCMPMVIRKKKASIFPFPLLVTFVYMFVCLAITPIWHPLWVVFLTIPVYYSVVDPIEKYNRLKNKDNEEKE